MTKQQELDIFKMALIITRRHLGDLTERYLKILKTDRYKEDATFNVDEYYADLQSVIEDLRRLKKTLQKL